MLNDPVDRFKVVAICLGVGYWLIYHAIRNHRRARQMADTPRSKAISAPQGFVELEGFAWPADKTIKSVGGADSVYYSFVLQREETQGSGKNRRRVWVTKYSFRHADLFYLIDPTGLVLIDPQKAELNLDKAHTRHWQRLDSKERERIVTQIVKSPVSNFPPSNFLFGLFSSKFRVVENEIFVGSPLYASGDFQALDAGAESIQSPGLTDFARKVFSGPTGSIRDMRVILDTNGDGKVSVKEAHEGYAMAAKTARAKASLSTAGEETDFKIHGTLGSSESAKLHLADAFETHVQHRLTQFLWLRLAGGSACVTLGIVIAVGIDPSAKIELNSAPSVAQRSVAAVKSPTEYHKECLAGSSAACTHLISKQHQYQLRPENLLYYKNKACQLGAKVYCP